MPIEQISLLLGRSFLRPWLREALMTVERETDASVDLIVRTDTDGRPLADTENPFDADVVFAEPIPADDEFGVELPEETVQRVADHTDVAVQNGVGILTGTILDAPEHGVLSYHHGDIREYRGVITHFWNYLDGVEEAGVTLLQLTEELDGGRIAAERTVDLRGAVTWSEVESRKQLAGVSLLREAVENFQDPAFDPPTVDESDLGRMYYSDDVTPPVIGRYLLDETLATVRDRVGNLRYLLEIYRS